MSDRDPDSNSNSDFVSQTLGPVLSQTGLAKHFGVSAMAVWRWRRDLLDMPPGIEIAGRLYWSIQAVERWKAKRAANAKPRQPKSQGARADQARSLAVRKHNSTERREAEHELAAHEPPKPTLKSKRKASHGPRVGFAPTPDAEVA
jgi:hypothetical protein